MPWVSDPVSACGLCELARAGSGRLIYRIKKGPLHLCNGPSVAFSLKFSGFPYQLRASSSILCSLPPPSSFELICCFEFPLTL